MSKIPNILSTIRIVLASILFFLSPYGFKFWVIYLLCGISDVLDGYIARKTNSVTKLGSMLDSIGDFIFFFAAAYNIFPLIIMDRVLVIWILIIAVIRFISLFIVYKKYNIFVILHTYANKMTGVLIFSFPFIYVFYGNNYADYFICSFATFSSLEEIILNIQSKVLDVDVKGIWSR